jgi:hypothetical protein
MYCFCTLFDEHSFDFCHYSVKLEQRDSTQLQSSHIFSDLRFHKQPIKKDQLFLPAETPRYNFAVQVIHQNECHCAVYVTYTFT